MKFNPVTIICFILLNACDTANLQETRSQLNGSTVIWENLATRSSEDFLNIVYRGNKTGGFSLNVEDQERHYNGPFRAPVITGSNQDSVGNRCILTNSYAHDRNNLTPSLSVNLGNGNERAFSGSKSLTVSIYNYKRDISDYRTSPISGSIHDKGGYVMTAFRDDEGNNVSYNSAEVPSNCFITVNALNGRVYGAFRCQGLHKKVNNLSQGQTPSHIALEGSFDCDLVVTLKTTP